MRALLKVVFISLLLLKCSADTYPGGVAIAPTTEGFSIHLNYLTDLGRYYALNGDINGIGSTFFVVAVMLLVVPFGNEILALGLNFDPGPRRLVVGGAIVGVLACALFAASAVEMGEWMVPYRDMTMAMAVGITPAVPILFAAAALIDPDIPGQVTLSWMALALCITIYAGIVFWGPSAQTVDGLQFRVRAQQIISCITVGGLVFIVWQTRRALDVPED